MSLPRLLDANANRAREAMRVMEDLARFVLDDDQLSLQLKTLRHDLRAALDRLPPGWLESARDTAGDVGTGLSTPAERSRSGAADVAAAAGKRLGEALRVIEETAKIVRPDLASPIEALRYRGYDLDARLQRRLATGRARQWRLCVLLTEAACRRSWSEVAAACIEHGADCIQLREKRLPDRELLERARFLVDLARPRDVAVIVNDRADIALLAGADGVHLGQRDLLPSDVRRLAGRSLFVGVSTHDLAEAEAAVADGADYCGVGTIFPSPLKPERPVAGVAYLRRFLERFPAIPHLAIGGIDTDSVAAAVEAGARGVAVCSAVCGADDPGAVVAGLGSRLSSADGH